MNLEIRINTDNDAFHQGDTTGAVMRAELLHLLGQVVDFYVDSLPHRIESEVTKSSLRDSNGNTCGTARAIGNVSSLGITLKRVLNV